MSDLGRINTVDELYSLQEKLAAEEGRSTEPKEKILLCAGGGCIASGSLKVKEALESQLKIKGLDGKVALVETGCPGPCALGPVIVMGRDKVFYQRVSPDDVEEIVERHVIGGEIVDRLVWKEGAEEKPVPIETDIEYFKRQTKIVLRNSGRINPTSLKDYLVYDGYRGLAKALSEYTSDEVIDQIKKRGLKGRGGAGFPTYLKWTFAKKNESDQKFILCNADEGDPGAFMDRSVLEGDPYSLIEGMSIGAYAIGASQGYIYVRAEYPLAVERLQKAINQARSTGLIGENIFSSGFSFDLEIRMGSGAFVCGEETALIASIEGKRGEPRPRPPFPAAKGLWDKPTVLNNVETFANIAPIVLNGGDWFAELGTDKSKGTKVFALAGAIKRAGLVEVPIGTTLGELIYDIGGGIPNGREFKAAQIGGPSGGCIPKHHLNVSLDYESLNSLGAIMGSGGLVVMDETACMVDVARFFLEFVAEESCGKCTPCRVGTKRMLEILDKICSGHGEMEDLERLETLGRQIQDTALCGLGQTAPNPVLSTIRHFKDEYIAHIKTKHCPAGVCPDLVRAPCQSACPANVDVPGFLSLVAEQRYAEALRLHRERNPFAAVCARVCVHPCESKCRRATLDSSVFIRGVKRFMVDQEITIQVPKVLENSQNAKRKIAIVGAGPAGLTCAYFLARLGYKPVVFEAEQRPGGMLVQTIPAYRLPREILAREIRMIENLGVDIITNKKLGRDFTLSSLKDDGYETVFLSFGAPKGVLLDIPGSDAQGVDEAIEFLKTYNLRGSVSVGKKVVVVGGGNAAIDAARTAIRLGSEVDVIYRRTQDEMPAYKEEIEEAIQEGINVIELTNPQRILVEDGKVAGIECCTMKLGEYDSSGRRRPEPRKECFVMDCDQVIFAIGQKIVADELFNGFKIELSYNETIISDPVTCQTSVPWIFAGGDATTGSLTVIEAIASGEKAAVGIDFYLTGEKHAFWREEKTLDTYFDPDAEPSAEPRKGLPLMPIERRRYNFDEVEQTFTENEAIRQAQRCLRCDYGKSCSSAKEL